MNRTNGSEPSQRGQHRELTEGTHRWQVVPVRRWRPNRRLSSFAPVVLIVLSLALPAQIATAAKYDTGFEDAGWTEGLVDLRTSDIRNTHIVTDGIYESGLGVRIPSGSFRGLGPRQQLPKETEEAWYRYHIKLVNFEAESSGKLPGFSGLYSSSAKGCVRPTTHNPGWSARGLFGAAGTRGAPAGEIPIGTYLYHADQPRDCGESSFWPGASLRPSKWHCIEGFVKLNTPGQNDGAVKGWLDGTERYSREGLQFRRSSESRLFIKEMWLDIYYGGNSPAPNTLDLVIDEVAVSTSGRIGCLNQDKSIAGSFSRTTQSIVTYSPADGSWRASTSTGQSFNQLDLGSYRAPGGWTTQLVGDFTGNGDDEIASFHTGTGNWVIASVKDNSIRGRVWNSFKSGAGWKSHFAGDFTGDGLTEIASFHSNGTWWVSQPTSSLEPSDAWSQVSWARIDLPLIGEIVSDVSATPPPNNDHLTTERWGTFTTRHGWSDHVVGDFDGDGYHDIASYHSEAGNWVVARSTGSSFAHSVWASFGTRSGWTSPLMGDFNGDGRDDIANYHPNTGNWVVAESVGTTFVASVWASFETKKNWASHLVGDFNGDGRDDIANYHSGTGSWVVAVSAGHRFNASVWTTFSTRSGWMRQLVGDFNYDGRDDIANFHIGSEKWVVAESSGSAFVPSSWAGSH